MAFLAATTRCVVDFSIISYLENASCSQDIHKSQIDEILFRSQNSEHHKQSFGNIYYGYNSYNTIQNNLYYWERLFTMRLKE